MLPPSPPRAERIPGLIVIIPAHNEDRFIGSVVLKARCHAADVVVVDDGSTDATASVAQAAGARVVRHERNLGKSAALNTALELAHGGEAAQAGVRTLEGIYRQGVRHLAEGVSIRATGRLMECDKDTVCHWLPRVSCHCHPVLTLFKQFVECYWDC
jgi:glycosyltransferase involved in cell wall biosynthesis